MKLTIKSLALAVALAASATGANAAINNGAIDGAGELFFSAYDGVSSYVFDLNTSITGFESAVSATGLLDLSWGTSTTFTSSFSSWLSTANSSTLQWSVLATDTAGVRRILSTVGSGDLPASNNKNDALRTAALNIQTFIGAANLTLVGDSGVTNSTTAASYAGTMGGALPKINFDTTGTLAAVDYANGLTFEKTTALATGLALGINTAYSDQGAAVRTWIDSSNTLHIAAVPEPESYAMLLAGLGLLGFMARRNKRA